MSSRIERAAQAQRLRAEGLRLREIADRMGVARSTVSAWLNDPDGSNLKARKDGYRGTCERCGARTDGSNGAGASPTLCIECTRRERHEDRHWTRERIVSAIQEFARLEGRQPRVLDFDVPTTTRNGTPGRRLDGRWPPYSIVQREFGTWNDAIRAAGFEPFDPHAKHEWAVGRPLYGRVAA